MSRCTYNIILAFFVCIAIVGSWHGFPMIDSFSDESYFVKAPLLALQSGNFLPHGVPYGTLTYFLLLPIHTFVVTIVWLMTLMTGETLEHFLFMRPFVGYIAPRLLNIVLYIASAIIVLNTYKKTKTKRAEYGQFFALIFMLSTPLLLIFHSGKMWGTSNFLILASGLALPSYPLYSVLLASLSFGNFPIMGIMWLASIICACRICRSSKKDLAKIILVGVFVPTAIMALNSRAIVLQCMDIAQNFIGANLNHDFDGKSATYISVILKTLTRGGISILHKTWITSAFAILALTALLGARLKHRLRCFYAIMGIGIYTCALTLIITPGYNMGSGFRYISPIIILLVVCISSFEVPVSRTRTVILSGLTILSVISGIIFTINLALPTTYNRARHEMITLSASQHAIFLSTVVAMNFPYTVEAAQLTKKWMPQRCSTQCAYALKHPEQSPKFPTYILINDATIHDRMVATLTSRHIIDINEEASNSLYVGIESGAGNIFTQSAWNIVGFGRRIHWKAPTGERVIP